ncbi:MAG: PEP-CTERM sorting domain-containing protein [Planctomycetota bacterium]
MTRKLIIWLVVFCLAGTANAISLSFSTDGSTPLPDGATIDVAPGSTTTLYILSDTGGAAGGYWNYLEMELPQAGSIPFWSITSYVTCGDKVDYSTPTLMDYLLTVACSEGDIPAGLHWSFDLIISPSAATDGSDDFDFWVTGPNDSTYAVHRTLNIHIPEPGTIALLGLGTIVLLRRRKREKA